MLRILVDELRQRPAESSGGARFARAVDSGKRSSPFVAALASVFVIIHAFPAFAQPKPERFFLAGRYDGNRVVVYFDAVKFGPGISRNARRISPPVVSAFFDPVALSASYLARVRKPPGAERFALGDRYDLLLGGSQVMTFRLTTLVGFPGDEGVGNDSFIGALGTLDNEGQLFFQKDYYIVRHHRESKSGPPSIQFPEHAALLNDPVPFDIQTQVASQLQDSMLAMAPNPIRLKTAKLVPAFEMQSFTLVDGSLRYYVRAEWKSGEEEYGQSAYALAAWMSPQPKLHILAVETQTSQYGFAYELPVLHNVFDLGGGKTGIIISSAGEDSTWLMLLEYRDGGLAQMHELQTIGSAE